MWLTPFLRLSVFISYCRIVTPKSVEGSVLLILGIEEIFSCLEIFYCFLLFLYYFVIPYKLIGAMLPKHRKRLSLPPRNFAVWQPLVWKKNIRFVKICCKQSRALKLVGGTKKIKRLWLGLGRLTPMVKALIMKQKNRHTSWK